jgi:NAD+ synthase (glutamine-hydrolysing)
MIRIAGATVNQTPIDWKGNRNNILEAIRQAQENKVEILCLPELCITGYGCEDLFLGEWIYDKALASLKEIIPHCQNILVAIGMPLKIDGLNYNTTCLVRNGVIEGFYIKQYMALDGVHYEPRWFVPWPAGKVTTVPIDGTEIQAGDILISHKSALIGFEICEDAWRKEIRPAYRCVTRGVNLIMNPSASHFAFGKTILREELVVNSSRDFHCTYLFSNLLGNEAGRMIYDGEILIARDGVLIQRNDWLSFHSVNLVFADIDFENPTQTYDDAPVYARDTHTEFVKAASLALFDYLRKSHSRGFILSLSGGADSSTTAVLVAEMVRRALAALGKDAFFEKTGLPSSWLEGSDSPEKNIMSHLLVTAYQATENSSDKTEASARNLAGSLGATYYKWEIDHEIAGYTGKIERAIGRELTWERDDITLQNIQARARSPIIWMLANIHNSLLLTTSNRSEGDVGYTTMDGDTSGSIAPIAGVSKHFIIQWLRWAEEELGYSGLSYVNSLQPSAELRPLENSQTDEEDLMPFVVLLEIEILAIRERKSPMEVFQKLKGGHLESDELLKTHIARFFRLWSRNQWKRERIAPSFHLDDFNVDPRSWCRFPILSSGFAEELQQLDSL